VLRYISPKRGIGDQLQSSDLDPCLHMWYVIKGEELAASFSRLELHWQERQMQSVR